MVHPRPIMTRGRLQRSKGRESLDVAPHIRHKVACPQQARLRYAEGAKIPGLHRALVRRQDPLHNVPGVVIKQLVEARGVRRRQDHLREFPNIEVNPGPPVTEERGGP